MTETLFDLDTLNSLDTDVSNLEDEALLQKVITNQKEALDRELEMTIAFLVMVHHYRVDGTLPPNETMWEGIKEVAEKQNKLETLKQRFSGMTITLEENRINQTPRRSIRELFSAKPTKVLAATSTEPKSKKVEAHVND